MQKRPASALINLVLFAALFSLSLGALFFFSRKTAVARRVLLWPVFSPMVNMPGKSYGGPFNPLTPSEKVLRERLEKRVNDLSLTIGERSINRYAGMQQAMTYVTDSFAECGYSVEAQALEFDGKSMSNFIVEKKGTIAPDEIVVIGAHYDTVPGSPGADDNATGVAAVLELARIFKSIDTPRTLRFVAFANEEHPGGTWESMGSYAYAARCRERHENIVGMLSLEMLGFYSNIEESQKYPEPFNLFYPTVANFIGFVANTSSKKLVKQTVATFRKSVSFPSEGLAAPDAIRDVGRSDHWSFWQFKYPALMVTDTSNFRYQHYHTAEDTPDKLDFERFTIVVTGLVRVACELAGVDGATAHGLKY